MHYVAKVWATQAIRFACQQNRIMNYAKKKKMKIKNINYRKGERPGISQVYIMRRFIQGKSIENDG